jgi:hypothetical protein
MNDFETRSKSTALGNTDFIAKPYIVLELTLKALVAMRKKSRAVA